MKVIQIECVPLDSASKEANERFKSTLVFNLHYLNNKLEWSSMMRIYWQVL
jgi:hypothetical protein